MVCNDKVEFFFILSYVETEWELCDGGYNNSVVGPMCHWLTSDSDSVSSIFVSHSTEDKNKILKVVAASVIRHKA